MEAGINAKVVIRPMAATFRGSAPALVTPFKDGAVDEEAFRALVDWQIILLIKF